MPSIGLFVEDFAHEEFLNALLRRMASEHGIPIELRAYSTVGGHGKVLSELRIFLRELRQGRHPMPDLLVIATDANCKGFRQRRDEVEEIVGGPGLPVTCAIPDPHIERWLLLDSRAFKAAVGKGCQTPDLKCERKRYKKLLVDAVRDAGRSPTLAGIEHAQPIVEAMDLAEVEKRDDSLGRLLKALRERFRDWQQG